MDEKKTHSTESLARVYKRYGIVNRIGFWIGLVAIYLMMLLICIDVIYRNIVGQSIMGIYSVVQNYLMPLSVYACVGYTFSAGIMPRMLLVTNLFRPKLRRLCTQFALLVNMVIFTIMAVFTMRYAIISAQNSASVNVGLSEWIIWPVYAVLALGYLQGIIENIFTFIKNCKVDRDQSDTFDDLEAMES